MQSLIILATKNAGKVREIQDLLSAHAVKVQSLLDFGPLPGAVEDGQTFDDNAYKKALHYAKVLGLPCLADDSGLCVDALGGWPGVFSARYEANTGMMLPTARRSWRRCEDRRSGGRISPVSCRWPHPAARRSPGRRVARAQRDRKSVV